jgi:crotonobetainyl-CoA:carnitine CoA-transferase CaiB-like acyl-CoA transferase
VATDILSGITVLDLTRVMSGPYCTLMLADMGARVIKVERPGSGDDTRAWGPPFVSGESAYFLSVNRNKESLTLDFKHPDGRRILDTLLDRADVLVENFKPGTMQRLGLDYGSLAARHLRLIYVSVSGYGQTGPLSARAGYDAVTQAESGLMSVTGEADGPPARLGVPIADLSAGLFAAQGVLAALLSRASTGRGQYVDVSMLDSVAALLTYHATAYLTSGENPPRMGNGHASIVPYNTFMAKDGPLMLAVGNDDQWRRFCDVAGQPELAADQRFATNAQRVLNRAAVEPLVTGIVETRDREDWVARLSQAGVPCGVIREVGDVLESQQISAREMLTSVAHPAAGDLRLVASPVKLSGSTTRPDLPPPLLGQHTDAILTKDLGIGTEQIGDLRRRKIV